MAETTCDGSRSNCERVVAENEAERQQISSLIQERDQLRAELVAARMEDEAHAVRIRQVMQCSIDAREAMLKTLRAENAALEQRVRELSADLEFANRKTRELLIRAEAAEAGMCRVQLAGIFRQGQ